MHRIIFVILVLTATMVMTACPAPRPSLTGRDILYLDDNALKRFLPLLPEVLSFSRQYQAGLSPSEADAEDYNEKYFRALLNDAGIRQKISEAGYEEELDFLDTYVSISLALDYAQASEADFTNNMNTFRQNLMRETELMKEKEKMELQGPELEILLREKSGLENRKKLYNNIFFIRKHLAEFDTMMQGE